MKWLIYKLYLDILPKKLYAQFQKIITVFGFSFEICRKSDNSPYNPCTNRPIKFDMYCLGVESNNMRIHYTKNRSNNELQDEYLWTDDEIKKLKTLKNTRILKVSKLFYCRIFNNR